MFKKTAHQKMCFLSLLLLGISASVCAQSSFTRSGINAALFDVQTSLNDDGSLRKAGGRIGYSIGGILDVGTEFNIVLSEIESRSATETSIGIIYGLMLAKQENFAPFSIELSGAYGYSFVDSSYYESLDLGKEGHGYDLRLHVLRDIGLGDFWDLRIGVSGAYRSYRYTIIDLSPSSEEDRSVIPERETSFSGGVSVSLLRKTIRGRTYFLGAEPFVDEDLNFTYTIRTGLVLEL
jgi:hypothetical protein